jgi:hypothetical protein
VAALLQYILSVVHEDADHSKQTHTSSRVSDLSVEAVYLEVEDSSHKVYDNRPVSSHKDVGAARLRRHHVATNTRHAEGDITVAYPFRDVSN